MTSRRLVLLMIQNLMLLLAVGTLLKLFSTFGVVPLADFFRCISALIMTLTYLVLTHLLVREQ